jgi:uncharacterized protein (TIGR03435 family)
MITASAEALWTAVAPAIGNHLWQSTLFAVLAGALGLSMSKHHARVRYGLWLAASAKFLIPFSLLVSVGNHIALPNPTSVRVSRFSVVMAQASQPFVEEHDSRSAAVSSAEPGPPRILPVLAFSLWLSGFAAILFHWRVRWRRMSTAVRASTPLREGPEAEMLLRLQRLMGMRKRVELASTATAVEPGVFGFFRTVLLLPTNVRDRLPNEHLEAVLAHELCHVRRRDNVAAAAHMIVEAVFWFHPLVWWLGSRLVEERERACDQEVLKLGNDPEVYAESILKTCRYYLESPLACVSGITGSDLKMRIVRIMTDGAAKKLSPGRKLFLAAAGIAAVSAPIVLGFLNPRPGPAQTSANAASPKFEVASIKPSDGSNGLFRVGLDPSGRFMANNITVKFLLEQAYGMKDSQISGAPSWVDSEHYDIEAKPEDAFVQEKLSRDERFRQTSLMMRSLLADRFKLIVRHETKEQPIYAMVVAKNGLKLHEAAPAPEPDPSTRPSPGGPVGRGGIQMRRGELIANAVGLDRLEDILSRIVGRVVLNQTGLTGVYDFDLKWTPEEGEGPIMRGPAGPPPADAPPPPEANGPNIFSAVQDQLGLKLESQKSPVDTIVIEHIEKPSEN